MPKTFFSYILFCATIFLQCTEPPLIIVSLKTNDATPYSQITWNDNNPQKIQDLLSCNRYYLPIGSCDHSKPGALNAYIKNHMNKRTFEKFETLGTENSPYNIILIIPGVNDMTSNHKKARKLKENNAKDPFNADNIDRYDIFKLASSFDNLERWHAQTILKQVHFYAFGFSELTIIIKKFLLPSLPSPIIGIAFCIPYLKHWNYIRPAFSGRNGILNVACIVILALILLVAHKKLNR